MSLTVYPNPSVAGQDVYVSLEGFGEQEEILVVLMDQFGRQVYSKVLVQENDKVLTAFDQTQRLAPGIYFVVGSSNNTMYRKKLVISSGNRSAAVVRR